MQNISMEFEIFSRSLQDTQPPAGISVYLQAMWYDAAGNWDKAHTMVGSLEDRNACHVHAYLHRREGDLGNAAYWYRKAGQSVPAITLEDEWAAIVQTLL